MCDRIGTITFKNGGHCVRALRCHQGTKTLGCREIKSVFKDVNDALIHSEGLKGEFNSDRSCKLAS